MIISDLNHIETVSEDNQIEGGYGYTSGSIYGNAGGIGAGVTGYSDSYTSPWGTGSSIGVTGVTYFGTVSVSGSTYASSGSYYPYYYYY